MMLVAVFLGLLLLYSLVSARLGRTIVTAPSLFTAGGMALLLLYPDLPELRLDREVLLTLAEVGLVLLLFTDATHINVTTLQSRERLPLRLLSIGMLLTIVCGAVAAKFTLVELSLWEAGILAAILAPTDAGLGQVVVQSPLVPPRIRQALDVEAGLNDGLSVPFLMFFIAVARAGTDGGGQVLLRYAWEQLGLGGLVGLAIGLGGGLLVGLAERRQWMAAATRQLALVTLPLLTILACKPLGASMFIAAYVAGLAVQYGWRDASHHSLAFTEGWGQLFDYLVFFLFGLLVALAYRQFRWPHLVYALLSLTLLRMLPVAIALAGSRLQRSTVLFMGWFGPRGLASIVLGLVFLEEAVHLPGEETIKLTVMVTVLASIFAHGCSALPGIAWYARQVTAMADDAPEKQA